MSQLINDLTDGSVYFDTMVLYAYLRQSNADIAHLFQQVEDGSLQAFTASLTFDEAACLLSALIREKYGRSPLDRLRQERQAMIDEFYPLIEPQLVALQHFPNLQIISVVAARSLNR